MKLNIDHDVSKAEADYVDYKLVDFVNGFTGPRNRQDFRQHKDFPQGHTQYYLAKDL